MNPEVLRVVSLVLVVVSLVLIVVAIGRVRGESLASPLAPAIAIVLTVAGTVLYLVLTGAPVNPAPLILAGLLGLLLGLVEGGRIRLGRRGSMLVRRGGSGYLVVWGVALVLATLLGQAGYAAAQAAAVLAMTFAAGWATGANGLLLLRILRPGERPEMALAAVPAAAAASMPAGAGAGYPSAPPAAAAPSIVASAWLTVVRGTASGPGIALWGPTVTIGRDPGSTLVITDGSASWAHARVELHDATWYVVDLNSSNGTWVNGVRVPWHPLAPGDTIALGATVLQFTK